MATAVDLAGTSTRGEFGGNAIEPMQGKSLRPAILGKPLMTGQEPIFWEHEGNKAVANGNGSGPPSPTSLAAFRHGG